MERDIYYSAITGDDGCFELIHVLYGEYTLGEAMMDGWVNVSGDEAIVTVDESTETFTLVNRELAACEDGDDNDTDGYTDYPNDPGCANASDDDETDPVVDVLGCTDPDATNYNSNATIDDGSCTYPQAPECSDGIDNDNDDQIDYPEDDGCTSPDDDDEVSEHTNNNGGGQGTSSSGSRISNNSGSGGQVLGAATEICNWDTNFLRRKWSGNVANDVETMQNFLNLEMNSGLAVDSIFGPKTEAAVNAFQMKYQADILTPWGISQPTGIWYISTTTKAKEIMCSEDVALPSTN